MSHEMEMRSWGENPKHEDQKYYCLWLLQHEPGNADEALDYGKWKSP